MNIKKALKIIAPPPPHFVGDGFRVHNFIPSIIPMRDADPFLVLDYNSPYEFAASEIPRGVGVHPHKGFETVTIAYHGQIEHGDSSGNSGIIREGDVQWMTAAGGILHKEHHEKEWSKKGGLFQMVQLWINLPAQHKQDAPRYQNLENKNIAKYMIPDDKGVVEVIAGRYENVEGSAQTFSPVEVFNIHWKKGASLSFDIPENHNTLLLMVEGSALINDHQELPENHLAKMANEGIRFELKAQSDGKLLLLSGQPLKEPIAAHGPFVMNTTEELVEAFEEFNRGKFGYLED